MQLPGPLVAPPVPCALVSCLLGHVCCAGGGANLSKRAINESAVDRHAHECLCVHTRPAASCHCQGG